MTTPSCRHHIYVQIFYLPNVCVDQKRGVCSIRTKKGAREHFNSKQRGAPRAKGVPREFLGRKKRIATRKVAPKKKAAPKKKPVVKRAAPKKKPAPERSHLVPLRKTQP